MPLFPVSDVSRLHRRLRPQEALLKPPPLYPLLLNQVFPLATFKSWLWVKRLRLPASVPLSKPWVMVLTYIPVAPLPIVRFLHHLLCLFTELPLLPLQQPAQPAGAPVYHLAPVGKTLPNSWV